MKELGFSAGVNHFVSVTGSHQTTGAFSLQVLRVYGLQAHLKAQLLIFLNRLGQTGLIGSELPGPAFPFQFFSLVH